MVLLAAAVSLGGRDARAQAGRAAVRPPAWTRLEIAQTNTAVNGSSTRTWVAVLPNGRVESHDNSAVWAVPAQRTRMMGLLRRPEFWTGMRDGFQCPSGGTLNVVFTVTTPQGPLTQDVSGCVAATDNNLPKQIFESQPG